MATTKKGTKNVFVSHAHEDDNTLQNLKDLLKGAGYEVRDGSIDSSKPNAASSAEYIKSEILAPRINWAGTLIVLITPSTRNKEWVNWEIEYANKKDKRIVGVWGQGCTDSIVPEAFDDFGDAIVGWQADRVMDAITGNINNWYGPDGQEFPARQLPRYRC